MCDVQQKHHQDATMSNISLELRMRISFRVVTSCPLLVVFSNPVGGE